MRQLYQRYMTKFPISMLLYYVYEKYGLQDCIAIHWLHNMLIGKFVLRSK